MKTSLLYQKLVTSFFNAISSGSFILSVVIWYNVLFQINKSSKILQKRGSRKICEISN